jgi:hypothetical protein
MKDLKQLIAVGILLLLLAACSSAPVTDQGKILDTISEVNKVFPTESWLYIKINYASSEPVLLVIRKGGCGIVESFNMPLCYRDNILLVDTVKIYSSPLWCDGFIYHLPSGDITIKQITTSQMQENLW